MTESELKTQKMTIDDILKSKPRFQIYGLLHIYQELGLSDLSERMGKAKSTVHEHLKNMIESGFVEVSRTEKIRSDREKHFYSWVHDENQCCMEKTKPEKYSKEYCISRVESLKTFGEYTQNIMENWLNFLTILEEKMNSGDLEEVIEIIKKMDEEVIPFATNSFYSLDKAKKLRTKLMELYKEIPDETSGDSKVNPIFGGISLFPIRFALDYLYPVKDKD